VAGARAGGASLIVLGYHRIAAPGFAGGDDGSSEPCDPGLFSACVDRFDEQLRCLKRQTQIVRLEEAIELAGGRISLRRGSRVLLTFDDGYRDNFDLAFPVLRAHGVPAVFLIPTAYAGTAHAPWWDRVAHLLATAQRRLLNLVKHGQPAIDPPVLLAHLTEAAESTAPPSQRRRFLDWDEARQMQRAGMSIGSHTHTHPLLSQLTESQQREELATSRHLIATELRQPPLAVAFPTGARDSFTAVTRRLARDIGYRAAFSFHGGVNRRGRTDAFDPRRVGVDPQSGERCALRLAMARATG